MNKLYACYCRGYQAAFRVATKVLDWTGPRLIQGAGSVKKLPSVIKADGFDNVLIVTDKVLHGLGLLDGLKAGLEEKGIDYVVYDGTQPNPTIPNIEEARQSAAAPPWTAPKRRPRAWRCPTRAFRR